MQKNSSSALPSINNSFYDELNDRWYGDDSHIIALLRTEAHLKLDYVRSVCQANAVPEAADVLDVGCGAGFISNKLAEEGYRLTGIDQSASSLRVAERHASKEVRYVQADAMALPFPAASFDVVLLLDVLEHVEDPAAVIAEAVRVLKDGGLLFFHTFNRTEMARWLAIKAVSLLAKDSPAHFHVWQLFITPAELSEMCRVRGASVQQMRGIKPRILHWPFWSSVIRRRVHPDFAFSYTSNLQLGYIGVAVKNLEQH